MTIETHCDPKSSSARNFDDLARARRSSPELACMSTKLTHHIFLRLAGPNKGPECCLGGAGHVVVPLFGVGGTPRGISFLPPKLMKINFKARKKKKPCGHPAPQLKVPPSAPYLPNNILALYLGQQALERCGESVLCSCMPALASSGTALASSGELWRGRQNFARSCAELDFGSQCVSMVM